MPLAVKNELNEAVTIQLSRMRLPPCLDCRTIPQGKIRSPFGPGTPALMVFDGREEHVVIQPVFVTLAKSGKLGRMR